MRIYPSWQALSEHAARLCDVPFTRLVANDADRAGAHALRVGPLYANFARQRYDGPALDALHALARDGGCEAALRALFDGDPVNVSEARPALHTALRSSLGRTDAAQSAHAEAVRVQARMAELAKQLEGTEVTDVINVGIGGSDLGPRLAVDALRDFGTGRFRLHFLNNADAHPVQRLLRELDPARTAVVLVSKSFGTQETLLNGEILKRWLNDSSRLFAVTAQVPRAEVFGVDASRILPMWDWVGGRYSLWSAVGFALVLAIGAKRFGEMLDGAALMDAHALQAPAAENLPLRHALTAIWNRNGLGFATQAVVPYDDRLALLPDYLQQLVMESLGKSVRPNGARLAMATVPVLWGGTGTSSQHSFFQALHQGTDTVPADFVGVVRPAHGHAASHHAQLANLLAQMEALANGEDNADAQKCYPGNRPSTLLLLDELTPFAFGALIAMFEHSVFLQATVWGINAFDQWGVELGKRLADRLLPAIEGRAADIADPVSRALVAELRARSAE